MPVSVKLYSTVISYAINQTICNYILATKLEKIIEIIQGKAVILSILLIKLHFSVRVKVYIMLSTFLLVFSSVLIFFLLKSVQILLLPICSTSRWRWHTNLYLSIRNRTLPTQTETARNLLGRTAMSIFFRYFSERKI